MATRNFDSQRSGVYAPLGCLFLTRVAEAIPSTIQSMITERTQAGITIGSDIYANSWGVLQLVWNNTGASLLSRLRGDSFLVPW